MKIVFLDWKCFNGADTKKCLTRMGHEVLPYFHADYNCPELTDDMRRDFDEFVTGKNPDIFFSYNYFPAVAQICHVQNIPYYSITYDSPYVYLYSYTMMYETNHVYLFDSDWVQELRAGGLTNVEYLVLPCNTTDRPFFKASSYDQANAETFSPSQNLETRESVNSSNADRYTADISFVGSLYNEEHNFYDRMIKKASPELKGFIEGVLDAQSLIYGSDVLKELVTGKFLDDMQEIFPLPPERSCAEPEGYRHLNYVLDRKLTSNERIRYLTAVGKDKKLDQYSRKIFTLDSGYHIPGFQNMGVAEYAAEMPQVFHDSRININISLRSITSGIPMRCMDIMSCGGFLLSNYQKDFDIESVEPVQTSQSCEHSTEDVTQTSSLYTSAFIRGVDYDDFSSQDELLTKIEYYLSHEKERTEIAENGYKKVSEYYSLEKVLGRILEKI